MSPSGSTKAAAMDAMAMNSETAKRRNIPDCQRVRAWAAAASSVRSGASGGVR